MAKRRKKWNEAVYGKYLREGRGQGIAADYIPWISIQDFASKGMVSRVQGTKTGRVHHLMSNLETSFFFILDWSDDVLDIREQYPLLDLRLIISIAETAQICYPYDPQSGFPYIMTSDFYVETVKGPKVVTIKTSSELEKLRVREKLEIERRYWRHQNIEWGIITENEINLTKARNIEWLHQAKDLDYVGIPREMRESCIIYFESQYANGVYLSDLLKEVELEYALAPGAGLNIYKYLLYWKRIVFNVNEAIDFTGFIQKNKC